MFLITHSRSLEFKSPLVKHMVPVQGRNSPSNGDEGGGVSRDMAVGSPLLRLQSLVYVLLEGLCHQTITNFRRI